MKTHPRIEWRLLAAALLLPVALAELGGWTLLWGDDFEGSRLDEGRWYSEVGAGCQYLAPDDYPLCGWGMDEMQYYSYNNALLVNGTLRIEARQEMDNSTISSARIRGNYAVVPDDRYPTVRVSARVRLERGEGLHPVFWMLPDTTDLTWLGCGAYGSWAASGQINILESKNDMSQVSGSLFFGAGWPGEDWLTSTLQEDAAAPFTDWHTYAVEWELGEIRWYIDGVQLEQWRSTGGIIPRSVGRGEGWYTKGEGRGDNSPFDRPFRINLALAVGGRYVALSSPEVVKKTLDTPKAMEVDWVRVEGREASQAALAEARG